MDVLIVDDEPDILAWMSATLRGLELTPVTASSGAQALEILAERDIGFVITDFMMPGMNGAELLQEIRARHQVLPVVVMSAVATTEEAVKLLRLGADDFLSKPIRRELLLERLAHVVEKAHIYEEARLFRSYVEGAEEPPDDIIVTRSPAMLKVLKRLPQIARADASVVVLGPSGSGKELVARALHRLSRRAQKPFVAVNCGALPEMLVESTLFGHRKGAFTGADRDALGVARAADGGTLFLDEVGDLALNAQVKLLRFLQTKEVTPVGDSKPVPVDVRIIAATHRNLKKAIQDGLFREDLYYRLNVITLELPSLDERPEDIPVLANHFLVRYAREYNSEARAFSPEALDALVRRSWSGNVRELENAVQRALVACEGTIIQPQHLQLSPTAAPAGRPFADPTLASPPPTWPAVALELKEFQLAKKTAIDEFERRYLEALLKRAPRMTDAAELAGIDRKGLWRLLKKHGIRPGEGEPTDG